MNKILALTGAEAVVEAIRQINPDVFPAYPITPTAPIIEEYAKLVADGEVNSEIVLVESEHSALSVAVGAAAAGARAITTTDSQGLVYMYEVLPIVSGMRLPIVMPIGNRTLNYPANIHCDHSDSMSCRDHGWIQIYSETAQEAYENMLLAMKLAERVLLPAMVMQDGFVTTGNVVKVKIYDDKRVRKFIGDYKPKQTMFDFNNPICYGIRMMESYYECKMEQTKALEDAKKEYLNIGKELSKITGSKYGYFESYKLRDAEAAVIALNSTAGTVKEVIDNLRKKGKKVGLLKIKLFRPFPYKEIANTLSHLKSVAVLDRAESFGAFPPLYTEIATALSALKKKPALQSYVYGLGGRYIFEKDIENVYNEILAGKFSKEKRYIGVKKDGY